MVDLRADIRDRSDEIAGEAIRAAYFRIENSTIPSLYKL
jgi:hypothetical protein